MVSSHKKTTKTFPQSRFPLLLELCPICMSKNHCEIRHN